MRTPPQPTKVTTMKKFLAVASIALLSTTAHADSRSDAVKSMCKQIHGLHKVVMQNRQQGVSMGAMDGNELGEAIVRARYTAPSVQAEVVNDFANAAYRECLDDNL